MEPLATKEQQLESTLLAAHILVGVKSKQLFLVSIFD